MIKRRRTVLDRQACGLATTDMTSQVFLVFSSYLKLDRSYEFKTFKNRSATIFFSPFYLSYF